MAQCDDNLITAERNTSLQLITMHATLSLTISAQILFGVRLFMNWLIDNRLRSVCKTQQFNFT
jgi:hypothetical protein